MPLLDQNQFEWLKSIEPYICTHCEKQVRSNYCRQEDEFFEDGHGIQCPYYTEHEGHRKYDLTKEFEIDARGEPCLEQYLRDKNGS